MIGSRSKALNFNADGLILDFFPTMSVEGGRANVSTSKITLLILSSILGLILTTIW